MTTQAPVSYDDLYERLGLTRRATSEDITARYRALALEHPADRDIEAYRRIREAYETLANPATRGEYDRIASTAREQILSDAMAAMQRADYASAAELLEQVLRKQPGLSFARNLLGRCYLYQEDAGRAVAEYERLTGDANADPSWWANLGAACLLARRWKDAERAYRKAVARGGDDAAEQHVGWAEVSLAQKRFLRAARALKKGIRADGGANLATVPLLLKLAEVYSLQQREGPLDRTLKQIDRAARDEVRRRYAAWRLGVLAWMRIQAGSFRFARMVAHAASTMQPADVDYDALQDVAGALAAHDHDRALRVVQSHVSFTPSGWLHGLGPQVTAYCREHAVFKGMRPVTKAPGLTTVNGMGFKMYGKRDQDAQTQTWVSTRYFVLFFLPVCPVASYRVRRDGSSWVFLGRVPFGRNQRVHLGACGAALAALLGLAVWGSTRPVSDSGLTADAATATVWDGTVANDASTGAPVPVRIVFDSLADTTTGYLAIGEPASDTEPFIALNRADSLIMVSSTAQGDTIAWRGERSDGSLSGTYDDLGGPSSGQHGSWMVVPTTP